MGLGIEILMNFWGLNYIGLTGANVPVFFDYLNF